MSVNEDESRFTTVAWYAVTIQMDEVPFTDSQLSRGGIPREQAQGEIW